MRAYRAGSVAIVNAVGTGVADDKAIYHYVPEMIRYYLGEEPILENVTTYLMSDREQRECVLERLDQVVVKPTSRVRRQGRLHRPDRDRRGARRARRTRSTACRSAGSRRSSSTSAPSRPRGRTATLAPRHVDLRPFAVFGEDIHIVPGGLTRVALREGSMIVNSSQGGGSKDTWVLEEDAERAAGTPRRCSAGSRRGCPASRSAAAWSSQQQQQQQ